MTANKLLTGRELIRRIKPALSDGRVRSASIAIGFSEVPMLTVEIILTDEIIEAMVADKDPQEG